MYALALFGEDTTAQRVGGPTTVQLMQGDDHLPGSKKS